MVVMTLLEAITRATAEAQVGGNLPPPSQYPIALNADEIFSQLKPDAAAPEDSCLAKPVSGWKIAHVDAAVAKLASGFAEKLKKKLKRPISFGKCDFLASLNTFLTKSSVEVGLSIEPVAADESGTEFACAGIKKMGILIGRELAWLMAECCAVLQVWEVLETLLLEGLVGHFNCSSLTEKLVEKNQSELLCLLVKHVSELQTPELLAVMRYFLSPTDESDESYRGMVAVKDQWRDDALLAIKNATQAGLPKKLSKLARDASISLMVSYDKFSSYEVCLHYVFGSSNADGILLSAAIAKLDGREVLDLCRYLLKWLEKYHRFPEAGRCAAAGVMLGLTTCESVPSLETIVKALGLLLDEHFSYLVLNPDFHDEMRAAEKIVSSLVLEANQSCPLDDVLKNLLSEIQK